jgi:hypothetical protein
MNDPIKIIHKYKNENKRIQYSIYIFVGDIMTDSDFKVLKKIKDMDLYTTLTSISKSEFNILVKLYGDFWYEKLFISHHINFIKENIIKDKLKQKELISIYDSDWYTIHFVKYENRIQIPLFGYGEKIKSELDKKMIKKIIATKDITDVENTLYSSESESSRQENEDQNQSWPTSDSVSTTTSSNSDSESYDIIQYGGNVDVDVDVNTDVDVDIDIDNYLPDNDIASTIDKEILSMENDIESLFNDEPTTNKDVINIIKDIKKVISNGSYNTASSIIPFNKENDHNVYDQNMKNIVKKIYVRNQYIYKDDTIKTIKWKICASIKNNDKFGDNAYIIPSYQYLWTEYPSKKIENEYKYDNIMLGQQWIVKNSVLRINAEPETNMNIYYELRGNLKNLRDNIIRQGKIKYENHESNILEDYENYYTQNEIFMIDIYNELGLDMQANFEELRNLISIYINVYFNQLYVRTDAIKNIIEILQTKTSVQKKQLELDKLNSIYNAINSDLILTNQIMRNIEICKRDDKNKYTTFFSQPNVTQAFIRAYLLSQEQLIERNMRNDMYHIYNNFILDDEYPYINYQTIDGIPKIRIYPDFFKNTKSKQNVMKWFENSPYGISFKIKTTIDNDTIYLGVILTDTGRIDYKVHWREEYGKSVNDISVTYENVRKLIKKINKENAMYGIKYKVPSDEDFKFAFITTIQKFKLEQNNKIMEINYNELDDFARYFFPYVALVIEPRKRLGKNKESEVGKSGTYLRYKRVSKYENRSKMEFRILFIMRYFEYTDKKFVDQISKEFNITYEQAHNEIENVKKKVPNIKKAIKKLRKIEDIPKTKHLGIDVNIQGKTKETYKIRIAGARDILQMNKISELLNILIYLYYDTYILKNKDRKELKKTLEGLTQIAKRKNKVEQIVKEYSDTTQQLKAVYDIDNARLTSDGKMVWSKQCQNSGNDKRRRPNHFTDISELIKKGYIWKEPDDNISYGRFEKTIKQGKEKITLTALQLPLENGDHIYYTCSPEDNGKHIYVGVLGKTDKAPPCCFIKDQSKSKNLDRKHLYLNSIGIKQIDNSEVKTDSSIEKLYVLKSSNKSYKNRLSFLPLALDVFFNKITGNEIETKNNYIVSTNNNGYYFGFDIGDSDEPFIYAVSAALGSNISNIKKKLIKVLKEDTNDILFTYLNNGEIRKKYTSRQNFINYIKSSNVTYTEIYDILCATGVLDNIGLNIIVFTKKIITTVTKLEKEKQTEEYHIVCNNTENKKYILDSNRENIILIKNDNYYYPVIHIQNIDVGDKTYDNSFLFKYNNDNNNIINRISNYYFESCKKELNIMTNTKLITKLSARDTYDILIKNNIKVFGQIIDIVFKCIYLVVIVTNEKYLVPVIRSGSVHNLNIITFNNTFVHNIGITYMNVDNDIYITNGIITKTYLNVPITEIKISREKILKYDLIIQKGNPIEKLDNDIITNKYEPDKRVTEINRIKYISEMYQLFRLHISYYLNNTQDGKRDKKRLFSLKDNKNEIKKILYKICNQDLLNKYISLVNLSKEESNNWINISKKDNINTIFKNIRTVCDVHNTKNCPISHCEIAAGKCKFSVEENYIIDFINKMTNEIYQNNYQMKEILMIDDYYVSNIVNYDNYDVRPNEQMVIGTNKKLNIILENIFNGTDYDQLPHVGKKTKSNIIIVDDEKTLQTTKDWYIQEVIDINPLFRAFANAYYWLLHPYNEISDRNLGYKSDKQENFAKYYKVICMEWLKNIKNLSLLSEKISKQDADKIIYHYVSSSGILPTTSFIELNILSIFYNTMIYIYDDRLNIIKIIHPKDGYVQNNNKYDNYKKKCHLQFIYQSKGMENIDITTKIKPIQINAMYEKN